MFVRGRQSVRGVVCVYIFLFLCMYTDMCISMCVCVYVFVCACGCVFVCLCVCARECVCAFACAFGSLLDAEYVYRVCLHDQQAVPSINCAYSACTLAHSLNHFFFLSLFLSHAHIQIHTHTHAHTHTIHAYIPPARSLLRIPCLCRSLSVRMSVSTDRVSHTFA